VDIFCGFDKVRLPEDYVRVLGNVYLNQFGVEQIHFRENLCFLLLEFLLLISLEKMLKISVAEFQGWIVAVATK